MGHIQKGITSLWPSFVEEYRRTTSFRKRTAPLQLDGSLEQYLVKEFMQFVYWQSKGSEYCEGNVGNSGEQKIDIAFIKHSPQNGRENNYVITTMIEAKYLRNRAHLSTSDETRDTILTTLKDLARQLRFRPAQRHGGYDVDLRASSGAVYGLIFVSYVCRKGEVPDAKKRFFQKVTKDALNLGLRYYYLQNQNPRLDTIYKDYPLTLFGEKWKVSLSGGLWLSSKSAD